MIKGLGKVLFPNYFSPYLCGIIVKNGKGGRKMEGKELLFKLSDSTGVSGNEHGLGNLLQEYFEKHVTETNVTKQGNFMAIKRGDGGGKHKIMIAAHSDEIGMMVKDIDDRGFIYFTRVGGIDPKTIPAQEVIIHGRKEVYGVVGAKPPHVLSRDDMEKAIRLEDMKIDVGMTKEEVEQYITVGDLITVRRDCINLQGDFLTGKALDDRAGIASMLECAIELERLKHDADVYFTATVSEEVGAWGAKTAAYEINPDIAIAVDVTFGDKHAGDRVNIECGKGVEITVGPNIHPELSKRLLDIADEYKIPYAIDVCPGPTGTDAWAIQIVREGIPSLLISIPLRYMHTSTEVISYKDVVLTGRLMALFIASIRDWGDIYA